MSASVTDDLEKIIREQFLSTPLGPETIWFYCPRTSILQAVKEESRSFFGTVLDLGCGIMPYRTIVLANSSVEKYLGMDLEQPAYYPHAEPDLRWNGKTIPLADQSVDCVMATEFLEHFPEPQLVLEEVHRVMKTGGFFLATVPFIWNLHEIPYDEYRYTPYSIERLLKNAGFSDIRVKALGGWNMALAQMIGLWVSFRKMGRLKRAILKRLLFPFFTLLIKTDEKPVAFDGNENSMFSGLSITACK